MQPQWLEFGLSPEELFLTSLGSSPENESITSTTFENGHLRRYPTVSDYKLTSPFFANGLFMKEKNDVFSLPFFFLVFSYKAKKTFFKYPFTN